jgi:hypothetical protein
MKKSVSGISNDPLEKDWAVRMVPEATSTGLRSDMGDAVAMFPAGVAVLRI